MESTIKSSQRVNSLKRERAINSLFWESLEYNRFGVISLLIVIIGCAGGFAASYGAQGNTIKLCLVAFPTILSLALVLGVAPMKPIIYLSTIALILDLLMIIL
jgi:hypothetical protein